MRHLLVHGGFPCQGGFVMGEQPCTWVREKVENRAPREPTPFSVKQPESAPFHCEFGRSLLMGNRYELV